ncbi:hypothetical protein RB601_004999 [Gaeumannomyces tritici]
MAFVNAKNKVPEYQRFYQAQYRNHVRLWKIHPRSKFLLTPFLIAMWGTFGRMLNPNRLPASLISLTGTSADFGAFSEHVGSWSEGCGLQLLLGQGVERLYSLEGRDVATEERLEPSSNGVVHMHSRMVGPPS